uniref:Cytochrome P450 n=1 Tax=Sphingomonas sp. JE1 TaxID=1628059 RepID=A0A0D5A089_9SPHN|nr:MULTISPECIES: cytochrome P450 [unclassified Sphingomonas]AJW29576.1 cytochrome P450 [Sphingomonas sp. JE1]
MTDPSLDTKKPPEEHLDFFGQPIAVHVPPELIRRIDVFDNDDVSHDPFMVVRQLRDEPPVIYNSYNALKGQSWIVTRAEDIRHVLGSTKLFNSSEQAGFASIIGETWRQIPIELDGAEHIKYRRLIAPWFSLPEVARLSGQVERRAIELIDRILDQGHCEFVSSFGTPFPVSIFMDLFGLPDSHTAAFLKWVDQIFHSETMEGRAAGTRAAIDYLRDMLRERRISPSDDIASAIANAKIDDVPISEDDAIGLCFTVWTGGLDTVASSLGFYFRHLAENPDIQARLRAHPEEIPNAVEEYLRHFAPAWVHRRTLEDTEIAGVRIKRGDWVTIFYALANFDPREHEDPDAFDYERANRRHFTLAFGPHFCAGANLARRELQIAIEQWLKRVPPFRVAEGDAVRTHGGMVFGVNRLNLCW